MNSACDATALIFVLNNWDTSILKIPIQFRVSSSISSPAGHQQNGITIKTAENTKIQQFLKNKNELKTYLSITIDESSIHSPFCEGMDPNH